MIAQDLIKGALRKINSYQSGEPLAQEDAQDCLDVLNALLDSLSTQHQYIFGTQEWVLNWTGGKSQYSIGNPTCTDLGESPFLGTVTGSSAVITGMTTIPADLKAGATLTDLGSVIPTGTTVLSFNAGAQTVTMSQNATSSFSGLDQVTYTIPGDFGIPRPLKISSGYTRIGGLDFTLDVTESQERYNEILLKSQPGPWPTVGWYSNTHPYGTLRVYQVPSGAELHLFTDTILSNLTLFQTVIMPQGYRRALEWLLSRELWGEYWGLAPFPPDRAKLVEESTAFIKQVNAKPAVVSTYDAILLGGNRADGGYIFHGGYR